MTVRQSRFGHSRPVLTGRGQATLVLGVLGVIAGLGLGYDGLAVLGGVLVIAVLGAAGSLLGAPRLTGIRQLSPRTVSRGDRCVSSLTLSAAEAVDVRALVLTDTAGEAQVRLRPEAIAPAAGAKWQGRAAWIVPTLARGSVTVGPAMAGRVGFCGLAVTEDRVVIADQLQVLPRVIPTAGLPAGAVLNRVGVERLAEVGGTDLLSLHTYQPGDDLRRLHWAASARAGTLMVREDSEPGSAQVVVILDDLDSAADAAGFDEMVDVAASLTAASLSAGHLVVLTSTSGHVDVEAAPSSADGGGGSWPAAAATLASVRQQGASLSARRVSGDIVVVVAGPGTRIGAAIARADSAAWNGAVLIDPGSTPGVSQRGSMTVAIGGDAVSALAAWDRLA